jgi:hypothetical protein
MTAGANHFALGNLLLHQIPGVWQVRILPDELRDREPLLVPGKVIEVHADRWKQLVAVLAGTFLKAGNPLDQVASIPSDRLAAVCAKARAKLSSRARLSFGRPPL